MSEQLSRLMRLALPGLLLVPAFMVACGDDDDATSPTTEAVGTTVATAGASAASSASASAATTASSTAATATFPVTSKNCGVDVTVTKAPAKAVSMNQAATEIMLALGLQDRMIGTAYLDDQILPDYSAANAKVPVLSDEYPSKEALLGKEPDFVYASYSSAFGDEGVGPRDALQAIKIGTYVSPAACANASLRPAEVSFDTVYGEIRDIGKIFGVSDRAEALITKMKNDLATATKNGQIGTKYTAVWYDEGTDAPSVGGCCGAPNMVMKSLGIKNVFGDLKGSWGEVTWEKFVDLNPTVIVMSDASWDTAQDKQKFLESDPATKTLDAVKNKRYVVLPFSATTPGIRNVMAVTEVAKFLASAKLP